MTETVLSIKNMFDAIAMIGSNKYIKTQLIVPFFEEYSIKIKRNTYHFGRYADFREVMYYCVKNEKLLKMDEIEKVSEELIEFFSKIQKLYKETLQD